MDELAKPLHALLLLTISSMQQASERTGAAAPKFEFLLAESGYSNKEISEILGKTLTAVAKAVSRGRASRRNHPLDDAAQGEGESPNV